MVRIITLIILFFIPELSLSLRGTLKDKSQVFCKYNCQRARQFQVGYEIIVVTDGYK